MNIKHNIYSVRCAIQFITNSFNRVFVFQQRFGGKVRTKILFLNSE
jgi:hypothetical protein